VRWRGLRLVLGAFSSARTSITAGLGVDLLCFRDLALGRRKSRRLMASRARGDQAGQLRIGGLRRSGAAPGAAVRGGAACCVGGG
jgi:hypothetical protein